MISIVRLMSVVCLLPLAASAADWTHWRGPDRNDHSSEDSGWTGERWLADQPRWIAEVGDGCSAPIVIGTRVYSFSWRENQEVLTALDADTGQLKWSVSYPAPKYGREAEGDQGVYSGPSSTPEHDTDTGLLYTLGADGSLRAWDIRVNNGQDKPRNVWTVELYDRYKVGRRPKVGRSSQRDYGYTSSALATRDALVVEVGAATGTLIGFDKRTGKELWRSQATDPAGHSGGPVPIMVDGVPCVAVHDFSGLLVARLDRGHEGQTVAQAQWQTLFANNIATVAVQGSSLLVTSNYNQNRIARFDISLAGGAKKVWECGESSKVCSPVIYKGSVYWAWRKVFCLDFETGKVSWSGGNVGDPGSCIMTADDRLVVWSGRGELSLVDSAKQSPKKYTELAKRKIGRDDAWPHVTLSSGRLYCKDRRGRLVCVDVAPTAKSNPPE